MTSKFQVIAIRNINFYNDFYYCIDGIREKNVKLDVNFLVNKSLWNDYDMKFKWSP